MKIVLCGGGTGGHITPTLAVAREIKLQQPGCKITYVIERNARFAELVMNDPGIDEVRFIFAGKLRRYHGESWTRRLADVKTNLLNLRDLFYLSIGLVQSLVFLGTLRPNVVFIKGGYVGLPVGAAAAFWKVPIVTHDSDTLPGLTNRIVSRWAVLMATAFPAEFYTYPPDKVRHVGVPVAESFSYVDNAAQNKYRKQIGVPKAAKLLFITGGSLGALRLNQAVAEMVPKLLEADEDILVIHQTGANSYGLYGEELPKRVMVQEFVSPLASYSGASDVVIARPGATTVAELATQQKACIVVPSPVLADGHQLKNAAHLSEQGAVVAVQEGENLSDRLLEATQNLLEHPKKAEKFAEKFHGLLRPDAARELAKLLLEEAGKSRK